MSIATASFAEVQKENLQSIHDMSDQLDDALLNLGLTDHQENMIRDIAVNCYEKVDGLFEKGLTLNEETLNEEFEYLDNRLTQIFNN